MIGVYNSKCSIAYYIDTDKWGTGVYTDNYVVYCNKYSKSNYKRGFYKESLKYNNVYILKDEKVVLKSLIDGQIVIDIECIYDICGDYLYTICCT